MANRKTRLTDPGDLPILTDEQIADLEAANGLIQFDRVRELVRAGVASGTKFRLLPSSVLELNRLVVAGLEPSAGAWRTKNVEIDGSDHVPPPWEHVPGHAEEMCDYINERWDDASPIHLSAYLMWRINWIHPFANGNGRTSRAVSYLVLCLKLGYELPGTTTVADQITLDRSDYYAALDDADAAAVLRTVDVSSMERLITGYLASQLLEVVRRAQGS